MFTETERISLNIMGDWLTEYRMAALRRSYIAGGFSCVEPINTSESQDCDFVDWVAGYLIDRSERCYDGSHSYELAYIAAGYAVTSGYAIAQ